MSAYLLSGLLAGAGAGVGEGVVVSNKCPVVVITCN